MMRNTQDIFSESAKMYSGITVDAVARCEKHRGYIRQYLTAVDDEDVDVDLCNQNFAETMKGGKYFYTHVVLPPIIRTAIASLKTFC